jgi:4-hydroxy-3-methylbut-2-en-1-yl diphosphate synthase IspG/GcpE
LDVQDGLGDTIRVSLTEPPEEEIDPCRRLANLGMRAAEIQQGVVGYMVHFIKLTQLCSVKILQFMQSY